MKCQRHVSPEALAPSRTEENGTADTKHWAAFVLAEETAARHGRGRKAASPRSFLWQRYDLCAATGFQCPQTTPEPKTGGCWC